MLTRHDYDRHIAASLRRERTKRNITKKQMGDRLGIAPTSYGEYETGDSRVTAGTLKVICEAMGAPMCIFFPDGKQDGGAT